MVDHESSMKNRYFESQTIWEGKIQTSDIDYSFRFTVVKTSDNGGEVVEILTQKPHGMTDDAWDELITEMMEFIEEDYRMNSRDWDVDE